MRFGLREAIFMLVLLAVPVAAWWFVFRPINAGIAEAQQEVRDKQQKLQQLEEATARLDDLGREIEKLSKAIEMFEAKLPAEKEVEVILKQVWELASKHGLKPRSVRAEEPVDARRYAKLPLKMVIAGDFDGYYSFLLDLERLKRITRVPRMQLEKLETDKEGRMKAEFTLTIFFEPRTESGDGSMANAEA